MNDMEKSQNKIAVNVVLLPPDEIMDKAIEVNQALLRAFDNKVVLNEENCFPHISLAMGCIKRDDIRKIDTALKDIAEKFFPIMLTISDICVETIPTGKKVSGFVIVKTKELQLLHETVMNKLSQYFTYNVSLDMAYALPSKQVEEVTRYWIKNYPKESSFENFSPHITIGIGEVESETSGIKFPLQFNVSKLALCLLGNYCTCRKILLSYDLKMKSKSPLVSIGMPVYNGEKCIRQALDSLLGQTYKNFELIISDNASTDETKEICEEYAKRDKKIKYIRQKENMGATNNFNLVLEQATGEYFMWASYDDIWEPSFISELVELLRTNPVAVLAFCHFDNIDIHGVHVRLYPKISRLFSARTRLGRAHHFMWFKGRDGKANLMCGVMQTSVIQAVGGFPFDLGECSIDNLMLFRLALIGDFIMSNQLLFHKRLVPGSGSFRAWSFADWHTYRSAYRQIILQSDIPSWEKAMLTGSAIFMQMFFLIHMNQVGFCRLARHVIVFTRRRIGSGIRFIKSIPGHRLQ